MTSHKILSTSIPFDPKSPDRQSFALFTRQVAGLEFGIKIVSKSYKNGSVKTHFETDLAGDELENMIEEVAASIYDMTSIIEEYSFC